MGHAGVYYNYDTGCVFTPELQWQPRVKRRILRGGRANRHWNGEVRMMAERAMEGQFEGGASLWESQGGKGGASMAMKQTRLMEGFNTAGLDPYPEDA